MLVLCPVGVEIAMCPEVPFDGTVALICVLVALETAACAVLNVILSLASTSKFVPLIDIDVPGVPIVGVKLVMVGAPEFDVTVKFEVLDTEPEGVVTVIGPVVALAGTVTTSCVAVADTTVAATPLNCTVSCEAVALNPVPLMVTEPPEAPLFGVNEIMESCDALPLLIARTFPAASYL